MLAVGCGCICGREVFWVSEPFLGALHPENGRAFKTAAFWPPRTRLQRDKLEAHPLFERVSEEELANDPAAQLLLQGTEEGQKVARNGGKTWRHVYRRIPGPSDQPQQGAAAGGPEAAAAAAQQAGGEVQAATGQ